MPAIVFKELGIDLSPRKIVVFRVDRADLPHLTISWNNPSGEIDVHLTPPFPKDKEDRESVAKIKETEFGAFFNSIGKTFYETVRSRFLEITWRVRPIWLARNNYMLVKAKGESIEQWLYGSFPKRRGKHRADVQALRNMPKHGLYHPTPRRLAELKDRDPVWAVRTSGYERGRILILKYLVWRQGRRSWVAIDQKDAEDFSEEVKGLLSEQFDTFASDKVKRIYEAMRLDEIGL